MLYKWSDIRMKALQGINLRYHLAKLHDWQNDLAEWGTYRQNEMARYETIMTHIELHWELYGLGVQDLYDAASLCYLLLGGKMTGIDRDQEVLRLTKLYYKMEEPNE